MDKIRWEGCGMDVVIRLIDPEEELAEFLCQCEEFLEDYYETKSEETEI